MNHSPKRVGFLQAVSLSAYIGVFATCLFRVQSWVRVHDISPHPIAGIMLFLLAFVISALISVSLIFAYPVILFSGGQTRNALKIVLWSAIWLVVIFVVIAAGALFLTRL